MSVLRACAILLLLAACGKDDPSLPLLSVDRTYVVGETVVCGIGGDGYRYREGGWSAPEPGGIWTDGVAASLAFRLLAAEQPLVFTAKLRAETSPPRLPSQPVHIYIRGRHVATWDVADTATFTAPIPRDLLNPGGLLHIDFHLPRAISPHELGFGPDDRRLAVFCSELAITPAPLATGSVRYTYGTPIQFRAGGGAERYERSGWAAAEPEFTWTNGKIATLELELPPTDSPVMLRLRARGIIPPGDTPYQPTEVVINGEKVARWAVGALADFQTIVPKEMLRSTTTKIELVTPLALAPKTLGSSEDERVLGLCVSELQLDIAE